MSFFAKNIKLLRKRKHLSQGAVAEKLGLTRSSLSGYENSTAQAPYIVLENLSNFYNISIDIILKKDLSKLPGKSLSKMEISGNYDIQGNKLRTLVTSSSDNTESNAEIVPIQAMEVYPVNFNDPDFIKDLPLMKLPFLSDNKKYRAFPIIDDSMPPLSKGSYVVGEFITDWSNLSDGEYYIVISEENGVQFKQVFNTNHDRKSLQLCSNNPVFEPLNINISHIKEVWKFVSYISNNIVNDSDSQDHLIYTVRDLQRKINTIEKLLDI
ncbi:MAG: helix-turn-helix transcriptional regulator [Flavobacteriales bacterium]|nr:helix-turn-helix transcriptional regulator [Flavobacteriales bacterium]